MYENWMLKRWETPMSDAEGLEMESLCDRNGELVILFQDADEEPHRYKVSFHGSYPAYRNVREEYRLDLWRRRDEIAPAREVGSTLIVENSPWINEELAGEPLLKMINRKLVHYLMLTGDDVIEVLCNTAPKVERLDLPADERIIYR
jgi:hypothetical protein